MAMAASDSSMLDFVRVINLHIITARRYMLARYMLSSCVSASVCPSVRHKPVLYQNS